MREIEAVIEQIQSVLAWEHDPDQEYMETLVADYSRNISAANERLRQCEALLSKGLRTEAIQQCEAEPNLLDLTAILDFPEVEFWADYVSQYELPPLPELMLGVAADLNDAYASEQPVAGLLKLHRLHALALSPLPVRIQVLRELARKDKSNPLWEEDLARYEDARLTQIETELEKILAARNTRQAVALERELTARKWSVSPSRELIKKAQVTRARLQTYDARKELRRIADALAEAFAGRDLATARNLAARWSSLMRVAAIPENDSVFESAAPALAWVLQEEKKADDESAYQNSIAAMTRALDRNLGIEELQRCADAVSQFDGGLPDELEDRMNDQIAQIEGQAKRKKMMIIGAAVAAVLVIAVLVMSFLSSRRHDDEVARSRDRLQALLTAGNADEAQQFYTELAANAPAVAGSPELLTLRNELDKIRMDEERRAKQFADLVQSAQDSINADRTPASISKAQGILDQAQGIAASDAESARVAEVRTRIAEVQAEVQKESDAQFLADLDDAEKQFRQRAKDDMDMYEQLVNLFLGLQRRKNVSEEHKQPIGAILNTLDTERAGLQRERQMQASMDRITEAVGSPKRFQTQLRDYIRRHGNTDRAAAVRRILNTEAALWSGPQLWSGFRDQWRSADLRGMPRETAETLLSAYETFMEDSQQFPAGVALADRIAAVKAIAARRDENGTPLTGQLREKLQWFLKLPLVVVVGETRHYTDAEEPPELSAGIVTVVPFRDRLLKRESQKRIEDTDITNPRDGARFVWDAPHAVFATAALKDLEAAEDQWEETFGNLVVQLVNTDGIDPIVKMNILYGLLKTGSEGSTYFAGAFRDHSEAVDEFDGSDVNWVTRSGKGAPSARITADSILNKLPSVEDAAAQAVQTRDAAAKKSAGPVYRWVGWLRRRSDRVWVCDTSAALKAEDSGALVVITASKDADEPPVLNQVGSVASGELSISDGTAAEGFEEGRPVFLVEEQP